MTDKDTKEIKPTVSSVLGEVVWLLTQSARHRLNFLLADLEWYLLPSITNGQFHIFRVDNKPVGFAMWAFVSDEVHKRFSVNGGKIKPDEWRSGQKVWLVDIIAPFGQTEKMIAELCESSLADYEINILDKDAEGKPKLKIIKGNNLKEAV